MPKCSNVQLTTGDGQNNKVTLLQSGLHSKGQSNNQETQGKEILTKRVVMKRKNKQSLQCVWTRGNVSKLFLIEAHQNTKVWECIHKQWCSQNQGRGGTYQRLERCSKKSAPARANSKIIAAVATLISDVITFFEHDVAVSVRETKTLEMVSLQWCGVKRWIVVRFQNTFTIHQSSRLKQSQHSQHDELQEKPHCAKRSGAQR